MSIPRIAAACCSASAGPAASLMPPALPRPPTNTWAFTTTGPPSCSATARASAALAAGAPSETGSPNRANSCLPWYSSRSTRPARVDVTKCVESIQPPRGAPPPKRPTTRRAGRRRRQVAARCGHVRSQRPKAIVHIGCTEISSIGLGICKATVTTPRRTAGTYTSARHSTEEADGSVDLYEYQGKQLFARFGIPVSEGALATSPAEARQAAEQLGGPVVVEGQVRVGGGGKAGGIKLASTPDEAEGHAAAILGMDIRGHRVRTVWIEEASDIAKEYYLSVTFDRGAKAPLFMFTTQ